MSDSTRADETRGGEMPPESKNAASADEAQTKHAASNAASSAGDAPPPTADQVKLALRKVKDPELNLNIVDLGLVYDILVDGADVQIDLTLTSPGCPAGPQIMGDVERVIKGMPGVGTVTLNLVWQPFWTPDKIEPRVRAYMGL